ncbi:MAG: HD domain-containing phosphohydrolase [Rhodocyclaceae bacterium]|jgi:hypothetical protein|nr:HD domain-containing phosphohydrolase [Rhodocyclaceae bacterium]
MLDTVLRPVTLPSHLLGGPSPCDFFDARGTLLLRAGATLRPSAGSGSRPLFCPARHANRISPINPLAGLDGVTSRLAALVQRVEEGASDLVGGFVPLAEAVLSLWETDADACIGYARLAGQDRPSVVQVVRAALFAAEMGTANGMGREDLLAVVGAALTMNLGSMALHDAMAALGGRPDYETRARLQGHPERAAELLADGEGIPPAWREAVLNSHENVDGSGYPQGLARTGISLGGRILRVADILAARLAGRRRRNPQHWILHQTRDLPRLTQHVFGPDLGRVDQTLARMLMGRLGAFPPGTLVRLAQGEVAVVSRRSPSAGMAPREVLALTGPQGRPLASPRPRPISPREGRILGYAHDAQSRLTVTDWRQLWGYLQ